MEAELEVTVVTAGFVDFEITWREDVFAGAPQDSSAVSFGAQGINFRARKPEAVEVWHMALEDLYCEIER